MTVHCGDQFVLLATKQNFFLLHKETPIYFIPRNTVMNELQIKILQLNMLITIWYLLNIEINAPASSLVIKHYHLASATLGLLYSH